MRILTALAALGLLLSVVPEVIAQNVSPSVDPNVSVSSLRLQPRFFNPFDLKLETSPFGPVSKAPRLYPNWGATLPVFPWATSTSATDGSLLPTPSPEAAMGSSSGSGDSSNASGGGTVRPPYRPGVRSPFRPPPRPPWGS